MQMNMKEWTDAHSDPEYSLTQIDFSDEEGSGLFKTREKKLGEMSDVYTVFWKNNLIVETIVMHAAFTMWNSYKNPKEMEKEENMPKKEASKADIFKEYLRKTKRDGVEDLIDYMEEIGFFTAPASGGNHMSHDGGLLEHSLNVLFMAEKISAALIGGKNLTEEMKNSIVIASLLHDLGKCGDFDKKMYVENILKSGKRSDAKPYKRNPELTAVPHAIRSIKLATLFIDLTEEEEWAILVHDGMYDFAKTFMQGHETQLSMIIHWADMWASRVIEGDGESDKEE